MNNYLGNSIRNRRMEKGISINALSRLSGVDRTTISKIENGERKNPLIITLEKIFDVLDMNIYDVLNKNRLAKEISDDEEISNDEYEGMVEFTITINGNYRISGSNDEEILRNALDQLTDRFNSVEGLSEDFDKMIEYSDVNITTTLLR